MEVVGVAEDPIVSSDIIKDSRASIIDLSMTQIVDGYELIRQRMGLCQSNGERGRANRQGW